MRSYRFRRVDIVDQTEWEAKDVGSLLQTALEGRLGAVSMGDAFAAHDMSEHVSYSYRW